MKPWRRRHSGEQGTHTNNNSNSKNRYVENAPDFGFLASLYPSFAEFVVYGANGKPRVDWTDFNATRELTRVLLEHDFRVLNWWIPDGQLCPTVPNRANYIHWIDDLLLGCPAPWHATTTSSRPVPVRGLDIGTGANCIYPLLGASMHGWHFVGTDITPVAFDSARRNLEANPHLAKLIEIRPVDPFGVTGGDDDSASASGDTTTTADDDDQQHHHQQQAPPVVRGVVRDDETFDFCMCNPPFFEDMAEAGANPRTACGGTEAEMVCPGGEARFIARIIDDSALVKHRIHWYTSMVGRKTNLKPLVARARAAGATMVKTTEFVQGRTSRWGLAWSFASPAKAIAGVKGAAKASRMSFTLEGLGRQVTAAQVLNTIGSEMTVLGAQCSVDVATFSILGSLAVEPATASAEVGVTAAPRKRSREEAFEGDHDDALACDTDEKENTSALRFKATVLQQAPGSLLVQVSPLPGQTLEHNMTGQFSAFCEQVERATKQIVKSK